MTLTINSVIFGYLILILIRNQISCRKHEECEGIDQPDVVVASLRSCTKYVFCDGDNSYEGECLAGNYFNEIAGNCDDPENVKCDIEENEDVISIYAEDFNKLEMERHDKEEEEDEDNLTADTSDDLEGIEDLNELPAIASEEGGNNGVTISKTPNCPELYGFENIRHIANKQSCKAFFTCYNGIAIPMLCPGKLYFHEETEKCEKDLPLRCKLNYSITLNCQKGVYDYMPHPKRCEYYHYCMNGFLLIMRCPYNFTWHYERGTCVHKSQSKCYFEDSVIYRYPS